MTQWGRDTPWRQGHLLPDEAVGALGIRSDSGDPKIAVVISHDCDIAQPPELGTGRRGNCRAPD